MLPSHALAAPVEDFAARGRVGWEISVRNCQTQVLSAADAPDERTQIVNLSSSLLLEEFPAAAAAAELRLSGTLRCDALALSSCSARVIVSNTSRREVK
jgi:hypothetical protein